MDLTIAIDRNRTALLRLVMMLFAAIGTAPDGSISLVSRSVRNAVLRALTPAESAFRRLVVMVAEKMTPPVLAARGAVPDFKLFKRERNGRLPAFALFDLRINFDQDPLRFAAGPGPRFSIPGYDDPVFAPEPDRSPDALVDANRLSIRLRCLRRALDDLPKEARRLLRVWARRKQTKPAFGPLRPGWPPGYRRKPEHEVDEILGDCHAFARHVLEAPDTS